MALSLNKQAGDSSPAGFLLRWSEPAMAIGEGDRIAFANPAAGTLLRCAPEELRNRPLGDFLTAPDRLRTAGGEEIPVLSSRSPLEEGDLVVIRDARPARADLETRVHNLEFELEEFRRKQEQIVQASHLSALGQMAAGLAHELNAPLSVIRCSAEFLLSKSKEGRLPPDTAKILSRVVQVSESAVNVIRHFLHFSRDVKPEAEPFDLSDAVRDALLMLGERLRVRGIELRQFLSPRIGVRGAKLRMEQVVVNLVNNAIDAMGGVYKKSLSLSARGDGDTALLRVQDTGCGIAPEIRSRLFTPFVSTKPDGTGLGLSVCYGIVREHGGEIDIQSKPGEGTTVEVRLPRWKGEE